MPQRFMITGAAGFVGAYLFEALARHFPSTDIVRLTSPAEPRDGLVAVDLLDRDTIDDVVATHKPDVVIHLAAQSSTMRGAADSGDTWATNVSGSLNLAAAVGRYCPQSTFLFASSSEVYGASFLGGTVSESTHVLPLTAYARSKHAAEGVLDAMLPPSCQLIVARPFNHSGPGQRETFVLPSFAAQIARIEAGVAPPVLLVGNIDVVRDFMDVRDVVDAYLALIRQVPNLPKRFVCNIASENTRSLRDLLETFRSLSHASFEVRIDPARVRAVDIPIARGEASLLRLTTGWRSKTSSDALLADLLDDARRRCAPSP